MHGGGWARECSTRWPAKLQGPNVEHLAPLGVHRAAWPGCARGRAGGSRSGVTSRTPPRRVFFLLWIILCKLRAVMSHALCVHGITYGACSNTQISIDALNPAHDNRPIRPPRVSYRGDRDTSIGTSLVRLASSGSTVPPRPRSARHSSALKQCMQRARANLRLARCLLPQALGHPSNQPARFSFLVASVPRMAALIRGASRPC